MSMKKIYTKTETLNSKLILAKPTVVEAKQYIYLKIIKKKI